MDCPHHCRDAPRAALTIREAADRLRVSPALCYRMARAGVLPGAARVGNRAWRVDADRLDAAIFGDDGGADL